MGSKNIGIVYTRISCANDKSHNMSLDSQEHAIKKFLKDRSISVFKIFKEIGSAFSKPQTDLKNILKSTKNKLLIVFEPSRLSRNLRNFKDIYTICKKNKHNIAVVSMNEIFNTNISSNYEILFRLIQKAENESIELGRRISRSIQYKKSKEAPWGKKYNEFNRLVDNTREIKIKKLIQLLFSKGTKVTDILNIINEIGNTKNKEPFEIIEYDRKTERIVDILPFGMSIKNIASTLDLYEIRGRQNKKLTPNNISLILDDKYKVCDDNFILNSLCDNIESVDISKTPLNINKQWLCIWFDPKIGLPEGIILPEGMNLPTIACNLYIPKCF